MKIYYKQILIFEFSELCIILFSVLLLLVKHPLVNLLFESKIGKKWNY